jgi:polysaccharide pyruvyl transferase WcaK-like protein
MSAGGVRIGLLGMYSSRNLGDTAIVREIMREIRARVPGCEFVALNLDPEDTVRTHGIEAFPSSGYGPSLHADGSAWTEVDHPGPKWLARGLGSRRIIAAIRTLDMIVMSGGGQVEDFFGGAVSQPRILLTWATLARLFGIPVAFFSVGVDQVFSRASRAMSVAAIRLAHLRSFRDAESIEILRNAGLRAACRVDPDPALGIDAQSLAQRRSRDPDLVVVSPISFRTWTRIREASYDAYVRSLAATCDLWAREGKRIRFVCSDVFMDPPVVDEVLSHVDSTTRARSEFIGVKAVDDFLSSVADARVVIASRLHGLILAVAAGTPVIAISPARKVTRFMTDCGLADYCLDISAVSADSLQALVERTGRESVQLGELIASISANSQSQLSEGYDLLVATLQSPRRRAAE